MFGHVGVLRHSPLTPDKLSFMTARISFRLTAQLLFCILVLFLSAIVQHCSPTLERATHGYSSEVDLRVSRSRSSQISCLNPARKFVS